MEAIAKFFSETLDLQAMESVLYQAVVKKKICLKDIRNSRVDAVRREVLRQFPLLGRAPGENEIAESLGATGQAVSRALGDLAQFDLLTLDGDGAIMSAYPFSHAVTSHKVVFEDDRWAWALCAVDALSVSSMFGEPIAVCSTCFHCDAPIGVAVNDAHLVAETPSEIHVWLSAKESRGCTAKAMCPLINFLLARAPRTMAGGQPR